MVSKMTFGEKIRTLRKKKKISQKQFADLLGMHVNQIGRYENDLSIPASPVIMKMSQIFQVPTDYLLSEESEKEATMQIMDTELLKQFKKIESFSNEDKQVIKTLIDAFIAKNQIRQMVS